MSTEPISPETLHHHPRLMTGRDPHEPNRVATSLEALFDLTFATCFGLNAAQFTDALAAGQFGAGLVAFGFGSVAICWAWINFSWFCSAYDTDDWIFRIMTMIQMIGVLILAIGLPRMFASIEHGASLDNAIMVLGYVIMRLAMVCQWLRAARQNPSRRRACLTYAATISIAQIGWVAQIFVAMSGAMTIVWMMALGAVEFLGPVLAERKDGGTPWHAHHISERYSLFALVAFGEAVVGTAAALSAVVDESGWSLDAGLVCLAGVGMTFGMWWIYSVIPSAQFSMSTAIAPSRGGTGKSSRSRPSLRLAPACTLPLISSNTNRRSEHWRRCCVSPFPWSYIWPRSTPCTITSPGRQIVFTPG